MVRPGASGARMEHEISTGSSSDGVELRGIEETEPHPRNDESEAACGMAIHRSHASEPVFAWAEECRYRRC